MTAQHSHEENRGNDEEEGGGERSGLASETGDRDGRNPEAEPEPLPPIRIPPISSVPTLPNHNPNGEISHELNESSNGTRVIFHNFLNIPGEQFPHQQPQEQGRVMLFEEEDRYKIKKKLMKSDVNGLSRLLLSKELVQNHILPLWDRETIAKIETEEGVKVSVRDSDTDTVHKLVFKRWFKSNHSYIFNNDWSSDFVQRRGLMAGDEIGLFWDHRMSRFEFAVLSRALRVQETTVRRRERSDFHRCVLSL